MKKLYYSSCSCTAPHIGVVIDDIKSSLEHGDEVYWAYCRGALSSCWSNRFGHSGMCELCHIMYKEFHRQYVPDAKMLPINKDILTHTEHHICVNSQKDIHDFEYKGVKIGMSILSTYYGFTRDLDIKDFESFKSYCIPLMGEICDISDYSIQLVDKINPNEIIIVNGRHFSNRFFYDISQQKGIYYKALEVVGGFNDPYKKICFCGDLPHTINLRTKIVNDLWDNSSDSFQKKEAVAIEFYRRRREGELVADVKAYVADQQKGLLPKGFDENVRNIAIFNSSPDEFAAIGGEWEENLLFPSQYEAIKYILEHSPENYHYYLRIHPNLAGVDHKAHLELYQLSEYKNITIIGPTEKVSTYTLLDKCEKTLTFGSTMGIEACYWKKPSIMIGHAYYEKLDVCYIPKSKEEMMRLIMMDCLEPKPNFGALKYAYYLLDRSFLVEPTSLDIDVHHKKFLIDFPVTNYQKIWGKKWIYQLIYLIMVRLPERFSRHKLKAQ